MRIDLPTVAGLRAIPFGIAVGCSTVSCMVGPRYHAPEATLGPLHNAEAVQARQTQSPEPPLDRWWIGFGDPVLTQVVQRALDQNLDLAAAFARVDQARAEAREAGAQRVPSGVMTAQVSELHQSLESPLPMIARYLPGYERNQAVYDLDAGASWEMDLFGGLRRGAEAASAQAQAVQAERLGIRVSVAAEAADAYLQIRGNQQRLKFADDQVATDARLFELVRQRFAAGAAAEREVAQAEALLAQAEATVPPLRAALEAQMNRLDVLMGVQPGTYAAELSMPGEIPQVPSISVRDAPQDLLRRRPDVIAAERRFAASNARIGVAIAEYYPKISLSGLVGFESQGAGHLFSAAAFQPEAAAGLRWRLFDFGRVDAEVAQAKGADAEALARYRQSVLRAAEDVENALMALVQFESQSSQLTREVDALARARDASQEDYEAGALALIDVLDADRELLVAQDDLAHTRADTGRAGVALFRALGGGW
jgi:NodT family efflux transporter outer membrane factor (OMF) lipoprotein